jgi:signal transduction histidine kinase
VQLVLHRAVLETRSDRGVMSWIDGNEMIVAACHDPFGELVPVGGRWPLAGEEVSKVALAAGRPAAGSYDEIHVAGVSAALRDTYTGLKYLLVMPVSVAGEDVAILCVSRRRSEEFTAEDSGILDAIARAGAHPLRAARLGQRLGAALAEVSGRLADAESVERVKTDILRLASHELRTPLTVLHGYLSMIRDGFFGDVPDSLDPVMDILERRTADMNGLVNDMLVAARAEDAPTDAEAETVDLRSLLADVADSLAPRVSAQHRLRVDVLPDPLPVRIDTERVGLALRNVLDNAVKYSPDGGEVVCSAFADGDRAIIRVVDHGLGIAPEDRDKLFTRFGRVLTTANSHIPGIGLGLYFAREVARRQGGDVHLVESDGPGSTFEITLPLMR